jgi:hypothetical protein
MVLSLISQSPDIQKILAFEGAFEKLFNTIEQEGGVEGGIVVHDALICVEGLLRFNTSNQVKYQLTPHMPSEFTEYIPRVIFAKYLSHQFYVNYFCLHLICNCMTRLLKSLPCNFGTTKRSPIPLW